MVCVEVKPPLKLIRLVGVGAIMEVSIVEIPGDPRILRSSSVGLGDPRRFLLGMVDTLSAVPCPAFLVAVSARDAGG